MIISNEIAREAGRRLMRCATQVEHFGYKVHSIEGEERVVIGVVGVGDVTACMESIEAMPQVDNRGANFGAVQICEQGNSVPAKPE